MDGNQQIEHFATDLSLLIDRYRSEYEMSYAMVVGCLTMQIHSLCQEAEDESQPPDEG